MAQSYLGKAKKMTVSDRFSTPWGGKERKFGKSKVSRNAPRREEEKEPIGETIGAEMAKRMRDIHTHTQTDTQTSVASICKYR